MRQRTLHSLNWNYSLWFFFCYNFNSVFWKSIVGKLYNIVSQFFQYVCFNRATINYPSPISIVHGFGWFCSNFLDFQSNCDFFLVTMPFLIYFILWHLSNCHFCLFGIHGRLKWVYQKKNDFYEQKWINQKIGVAKNR